MRLPSIHGSIARVRPAVLFSTIVMLTLIPSQLARSAPVYQVPAAIASDCTADVTQPLLTWIASVPDNSVLVFAGGGCYRIEGTLELLDRHGLTFEGNGATFRATSVSAARPQWRLVQGTNFVLKDMTIDGGDAQGGTFNAALQHSHGIELMGPSGVDVDNVTIKNVYGDCVYVGQGFYNKAWSNNVHVHDGTCTRSGRQGVAVTAGRNVLIERMSFSQIGRTVFDIEPNGDGFGAIGITFTNNKVQGVEMFDALGDGPVDSIVVSNNTIAGVGTHMAVIALPGQRHSNIAITDNVSGPSYSNPGSVAIDFVRVDGVTITGNDVPLGAENMALVDVSESCSVDVSGNTYAGGVAQARIHPYSGCTYTTPLVSTAPLGTPASGSGKAPIPAVGNAPATPTPGSGANGSGGGGTTAPSLVRSPAAALRRAAITVPGQQRLGVVRRRGLLIRFRGNPSASWSLVAKVRLASGPESGRLVAMDRILGRKWLRPKKVNGTIRLPIPRARLTGIRTMVVEVRARVRVNATSVIWTKAVRATIDSP